MAIHRWKDIRNKNMTPERIAENDRRVRGALAELADLRALREAAGVTQEELAAKLETSQGALSKIERRDDHRVSVLRDVVEALGGELEVVAVIKGKRVRLAG